MVRGLFPKDEQEVVLAMLGIRGVSHPDNIAHVLTDCTRPHTAWHLANIYLDRSSLNDAHRRSGEVVAALGRSRMQPHDALPELARRV